MIVRLGGVVAIQFPSSRVVGDEAAEDRFIRGARVASALDLPNRCTIQDIDETPADVLPEFGVSTPESPLLAVYR